MDAIKFRIVSSRGEIESLNRNEQMIHLAFRASNADIFRLLQSCPKVSAIQVPASYRKTLSKAGEMFLEMQGIALIEGDVWGHRKDINEYFEISDNTLNKIALMQAKGMSRHEIICTVSEETKMSPDLVNFVLNHSA